MPLSTQQTLAYSSWYCGSPERLDKCRAYDTWLNLSASSSHQSKCICKLHLVRVDAGFVTPISGQRAEPRRNGLIHRPRLHRVTRLPVASQMSSRVFLI
jgi:hypothetical protein